jgi:hypothetical protein
MRVFIASLHKADETYQITGIMVAMAHNLADAKTIMEDKLREDACGREPRYTVQGVELIDEYAMYGEVHATGASEVIRFTLFE